MPAITYPARKIGKDEKAKTMATIRTQNGSIPSRSATVEHTPSATFE
jgi:hypothetical protein